MYASAPNWKKATRSPKNSPSADRRLVDRIRQAVRTDQHDVFVGELEPLEIDRRAREPAHADGVREHVSEILGHEIHVHERREGDGRFLGAADRVIARQPHQLALAKQIRAGVTHVRKEQVATGAEYRCQRRLQRRHRRGHRIVHEGPVNLSIEHLRAAQDLLRDLVIDSQVPLAEVTDEMEERGKGETTGGLAGASTAQAIGDHHRVTVLVEPLPDDRLGQAC